MKGYKKLNDNVYETLKQFKGITRQSRTNEAIDILHEANYRFNVSLDLEGERGSKVNVCTIKVTDTDNNEVCQFKKEADEALVEDITGTGKNNDIQALYEYILEGFTQFLSTAPKAKKTKKAKVSKITKVATEDVESLIKQRMKIAAKISTWKKAGKNVDELEQERILINNKIKALR